MSDNEQMSRPKVLVLFGFMVVAGLMRAIPNMPPNFAPIGAMALFGGAYFLDRRLAYLMPLVAMLFSDFVLEMLFKAGLRNYGGFHEQMVGVYLGFLGMVLIGTLLRNRVSVLGVLGASLLASCWFFIASNFNVWIFSGVYYTRDLKGLMDCYVSALPFFRNTLASDLFYSAVMFGSFELLKYKFPRLAFVRNKDC